MPTYYKDDMSPDERESYNAYMKAYREKNREKIRAYNQEYNKRWRKENGYHNEKNWEDKNKKKRVAQRKLQSHIRRGNIKRQPCEVCGDTPAHGHHDDYDFPLSVRWLCSAHHKKYHIEHGEAKNSH